MPQRFASAFLFINRAVDGRLEELLQEWIENGWSTRRIARFLTDEGLPVSRETVRRWLHERDIAA